MTVDELNQLFGKDADGFTVGGELLPTKPANALSKSPEGRLELITSDSDLPIDLTYAKTSNVRSNHMLPLLRAIQTNHCLAYDLVNRVILFDGVEIPEIQLKTLHLDLSAKYNINFPRSETSDGIIRLAYENQFDPYQKEMLRIEREVEPINISNLSSRFLGTSDPIHDHYFEKWLVAFVGRQLNPGLYYRHMLVLQGKQNIGKDAMGKIIAGESSWITVGSRADFDNRDFLTSAHSKSLLIFDELERTTKNVAEGPLKAFLSNTKDSFVAKYSNHSQTYPRRFSYWGSCNQGQFLTDLTGNSRFHVIPVPFDRTRGEMIDLATLNTEREQILAGAIKLYRESEAGRYSLDLTAEQMQRSEEMNKSYTTEAPYLDDLQQLLDGRTTVTLLEVYEKLRLSSRDKSDGRIVNAVKASLTQVGFIYRKNPIYVKLPNGNSTSKRVWVREGCDHDSTEVEQSIRQLVHPF
jgi:predicted P-loop ATPase